MSMYKRRRISLSSKCVLLLLSFFGVSTAALSADDVETTTAHRSVNLGNELSSNDLAALPKHVFPDGTGLPDGSATAAEGRALYALHCASCHGSAGQGAKALELVGDRSLLASAYPDRGIAAYWPYAPALFEYIDRSMPPEAPGGFTNDELYALIAYLLHLNELIDDDIFVNKLILSNIKMPNLEGFVTIAK